MKAEIVSKDCYELYINNLFCNNWTDNELLTTNIKDIILKLRKYYSIILNGLYNFEIYNNKLIGTIIKINKITDEFYETIDLNVKLNEDIDFYLETDDYFLVKDYLYKYKDKKYYINIKDLNHEILKSIELFTIKTFKN